MSKVSKMSKKSIKVGDLIRWKPDGSFGSEGVLLLLDMNARLPASTNAEYGWKYLNAACEIGHICAEATRHFETLT